MLVMSWWIPVQTTALDGMRAVYTDMMEFKIRPPKGLWKMEDITCGKEATRHMCKLVFVRRSCREKYNTTTDTHGEMKLQLEGWIY